MHYHIFTFWFTLTIMHVIKYLNTPTVFCSSLCCFHTFKKEPGSSICHCTLRTCTCTRPTYAYTNRLLCTQFHNSVLKKHQWRKLHFELFSFFLSFIFAPCIHTRLRVIFLPNISCPSRRQLKPPLCWVSGSLNTRGVVPCLWCIRRLSVTVCRGRRLVWCIVNSRSRSRCSRHTIVRHSLSTGVIMYFRHSRIGVVAFLNDRLVWRKWLHDV